MNIEPLANAPSDTEPPTFLCISTEAEFERHLEHPLGKAERDFLKQLESGMPPGGIPGLPPEELAAGFAELWKHAGKAVALPAIMLRRSDVGKQSFGLLEIVDLDRPFLMDSIIGELSEQELAPLATFRAVVADSDQTDVHGLPEAVRFVQFVLPALTDRESARLVDGIDATLADVRSAVDDFGAMRAVLTETIAGLKTAEGADPERRSEEVAFLQWLASDNFVLLGTRVYHYPRTPDGALAADEPLFAPTDGLGILSDPERRILRRQSEPSVLTPQLKLQAESSNDLVVAKSNYRSRVHRRVHCDYIGVTLHGADGRPQGEVRFLGLFTADAYDRSVEDVPHLRLKVRRLLEQLAHAPGRADPRRLRNLLENYPRDELFQVEDDELRATVLGIDELRNWPRVRLFARTDRFDRFVSALLFVPRNRYDAAFEERAGHILASAHGGRLSAAYPAFGDSPMARIHYIVGLTPGDHPRPDLAELERQLAEASLTWADRFRIAVKSSHGAIGDIDDLLPRWTDAFGAGYREKYSAEEALSDIVVIEETRCDTAMAVRAFRGHDDSPRCFRFKLYHRDRAVPLADVLPILQHMGLKALVEDGFPVRPDGGEEEYWIHEFVVDDPRGTGLVFRDVAKPFEDAFVAVWTGQTESDGFNRLVLELGTSWREAALVRALARFRQQTGLDASQPVQECALAENPRIARLLLDLFKTRFDPDTPLSTDRRTDEGERQRLEVEALLEGVPNLDADRVLRRLLALILAVKRTNFYQTGADGRPKPCIALKIASAELTDLPLPKPWREIFVSAPNVEGSHLRFGPVARGGLRWSDRRDDFRSEVLGLVKAQQVKNAVIVPVGSKGGFYAKLATPSAGLEEKRAVGIDAYRTFLSGLLDITDNIDAGGAVVTPPDLVTYDGDDPYLVVAADKGTASFSDIANEVAASYGFWLDDAFASGGSAGYDHKAMGITARGAWEAVKRHFRERGKNIQEEPFTVVGVGDMSGDVFGNGMLLSKKTRLFAAFDHRDIFIDPDPDPALSWKERERLFALPRSSWQDYDKARISTGGGVFSRSAKAIPLSSQARAALDIEEESTTPAELMRAILKAPVELLYTGGIGTYVKGSAETNADAADKSNDAIRVNGTDLRAAVVGEGANLGFTQAARIEFACAGGRINTDAIDNSGGVDSSDLEVNIKILTAALESSGALDRERRDALLASMTDEVAELVLRHNREQTLALSLIEADAVADLDAHAAFIADFERQGRLDRAVEGLPSASALAELKKAGGGLTRPELAILMAYSKLALFDAIVASSAPDDPWFEATLKNYFPKPLHRFAKAIGEHRLRREIVATVLVNDLVNVVGPTFPWTAMTNTGRGAGAIVTAFVAAREIFRVKESWAAVQAADGAVPAQMQLRLHRSLSLTLRRHIAALARRDDANDAFVIDLVNAYRPAVNLLRESDHEPAPKLEHVEPGVPRQLLASIAALDRLGHAVTVIDLAAAAGREAPETAELLRSLRAALGTGSLYAAAEAFKPADRMEREAAEQAMVELARSEERLARELLDLLASDGNLQDGLNRWLADHEAVTGNSRQTIASIEHFDGPWSLAKLIVAQGAVLRHVRTLTLDAHRTSSVDQKDQADTTRSGSATRETETENGACHA